MPGIPVSRRRWVKQAALGGVALVGLAELVRRRRAPAAVTPDRARPQTIWGLAIGDVLRDRAVVWSRTDRPARMIVEWATDEHFHAATVLSGSLAEGASDFTAHLDLSALPAGRDVFVRVSFESLASSKVRSEPLVGHFRTAPDRSQNVRFLWGGDTAGQGWGIDLQFGGMKIYEAMRRTDPDFFIHCGDNIYADDPMPEAVTDASGAVVWRNAFLDVVPEKRKVAETLHDYRRAYLYNRYDANVRRFSAEVPQIWQWDDHEVRDNWSPGRTKLGDDGDGMLRALAAHASRAFLEYAPMRRPAPDDAARIYRHVPYGADLDVFVLDMRSYRAANGCNVEEKPGESSTFLGRAQLAWLTQNLRRSRATWKVIAADMPLGLVVGDGRDPGSGCARFDNAANGNGPVRGREFEIAEVLRFIRREKVVNVVWITADVHYCAAHYYDPAAARFGDFDPFWEFVAGPLNAGTAGPNDLDDTFGPSVVFQKAPVPGQGNLPPSAGMQFFGQIDIDGGTKAMTVSLKDIEGTTLFRRVLPAKNG